MNHTLKRVRTGSQPLADIRPECSCGWVGKAIQAHDFQATRVAEQEYEHLYRIERLDEIEGNL